MQVTLALSCGLGLSINHSTFVCTRVNDPLTTSVAGSIKNIMMTLLGALAFPDFRFRPSNAAGLGISMAGAIYYATKTAQRVRPPAGPSADLYSIRSASVGCSIVWGVATSCVAIGQPRMCLRMSTL